MLMEPGRMTLDLDDAERAALVELLTEEIEGTRFPLAPRVKRLRGILTKLGVGSAPGQPYPPPKPSERPSAALAKKRRR
jgi:hypothetical protein